MPACLTHYQFGQEILDRLDPELKSCALAYKGEFDVGLQGPDIFFFYKPYRKTRIAAYGNACHDQPALEMFRPILKKVHHKGPLAYMMGLICHYILDANCHPYVYKHSSDMFEHHLMEAAYDRHILTRSGREQARHLTIPSSGLDFQAMAELWPGMSTATIKKCVTSQRNYIWLLDQPRILSVCQAIAGSRGKFTAMSLPDELSWIQEKYARNLDVLYSKALEEGPEKIRQAWAQMGARNIDLSGFELNYKGEAVFEGA
ncbi:hypothetical protein SDC9_18671 [bioreactor metagenome]|uniref:Zinc dependent phospholipase C n=2 Tax=root TaxID=1 RepID=A0A098B4D5_DESHA|nr:zinc dependent phospholipase C family protein [Desulfitobacterium hafniense]MEA5024630.1 zinc dependent phospholipase C family protein [Desulfitobacterium hafniense]CDX02721.1 Zinc dependent phospholipase C [Desulfitobacterium hafniense]